MPKNPKSFFERLTGAPPVSENEEPTEEKHLEVHSEEPKQTQDWLEEETGGQLTVDMFQSPTEIIVQAMVAGVEPENLDISINQDMITIKGSRQKTKEINEESYYYKELYWGSFSRSILLPQEVDSDNADVSLKAGLLVIKLPKIDKNKIQKLEIKTN